jgi:hypothetical protein
MSLKKLFVIILLIVFVALCTNIGAKELCNDKAGDDLTKLKNWKDLRLWYESYPRCDDGYFAEGLSQFVTASLSQNWVTLRSLNGEILKNQAFHRFVMKHIDATADEEHLKTISINASKQCPFSLKPLCKEIEKNVQKALKDMNGKR